MERTPSTAQEPLRMTRVALDPSASSVGWLDEETAFREAGRMLWGEWGGKPSVAARDNVLRHGLSRGDGQ